MLNARHCWTLLSPLLHCRSPLPPLPPLPIKGGFGRGQGHSGGNETVTGRACPKGLYGIFCEKNSIILEVEGMASSSL
ncbi:hypothetical protein MANES_01G050733v8 [Manihot esculenta]|uniref:Uncharacterized protein n=1 Tax=Manihot esculenta TaxID=3983 RepID=A0ACB7IAS1_MANES|nr:hypothetical protein MANES_01G050733v8 [Manihot esculenta]